MRLWFLLLLIAAASCVHASPISKAERVPGGFRIHTLYNENGFVRIDSVLELKGKLPELQERRSFPRRSQAESLFARLPGRDVSGRSARNRVRVQEYATEVGPGPAPLAPLWVATEEWTDEWEHKYGEWVRANMDSEFFVRHNFATDCADVVYLARWIFARIHGLPAVNRLGGSGQLFTHESMKASWMALPTDSDWQRDQRFRAAMNFLLDHTYTHTLNEDSYPISIDVTMITPGAHVLYLDELGGHTLLLQAVSDGLNAEVPIMVLASTTPRKVREMFNYGYYQEEQLGEGGFMRLRWPKRLQDGGWKLVRSRKMRGYSREQYDAAFMGKDSFFSEAVYNRIAPNRIPNPEQQFFQESSFLFDLLSQRVEVVDEGFAACHPDKCPPGSREWEVWSTPHRDARIGKQIERVTTLSEASDKLRSLWAELQDVYSIFVLDRELKLKDIVQRWRAGQFSSDPNVSIEQRWGL